MLGRLETTDDGRPLNPQSIFMGIQRAQLPSRELIERSLSSKAIIGIPVKFDGCWGIIKGIVTQVRMFPNGMLVALDARPGDAILKNWACAPLWIPNSGSAGILAVWPTNSQTGR